MSQTQLTQEQLNDVKQFQRNEVTEYHIYKKLTRRVKGNNVKILNDIAEDELRHYNFWKGYSGEEVKPNKWKVFKFYWITRLLGLTFGIKLMENGENYAMFQMVYLRILR